MRAGTVPILVSIFPGNAGPSNSLDLTLECYSFSEQALRKTGIILDPKMEEDTLYKESEIVDSG